MSKRLTLDSEIRLNISPWDFYGFLLLACLVLFLIPTLPKLPLFLDCYYHLSVMRGFADAGGWVPHAFWEFAPVGRPQLYPPLFHLTELVFFRMGLSPIAIAKLFDFSIYPFFLFCIWWPLRDLTEKRTAFFTLLLLVSSYPLYLGVLNNIPFTLALIFSFLAYHSLKRGRVTGSAAALIFAFYAHTLMSLIGAFAFLIMCFFSPRRERTGGIWALAAALFAAAPLFVFQIAHRGYFNYGNVLEFYFADINIILYALAAWGLVIFFKTGKSDLYPVVLLGAMSVLLLTNRDRFLSGMGLVPLSLFGAMALDRIWRRVHSWGNRMRHGLFWGIFAAGFFLTTPMMRFSPLEARPHLAWESSLVAMSGLKPYEGVKARTMYHPRLYPEIARLLVERSSPDDIFFSNLSYGGGIISVLAHRATSFAMLREIKPVMSFDPVAVARYIIWFKEPQAGIPPLLKETVQGYGLRAAGETELVYLYENPSPRAARRVVPALVPEWACYGLMGLLAFLFMADLLLGRKEEKKLT